MANYCWDKTVSVIGDRISEIIEPSCGDGAFYHHAKHIPHFGYDIEPECSFENIIQGDFLQQNITYLPGRLAIGNPPFGERNSLAVKFYKKCVEVCDYIAFILPISQFNNDQQMYEFDLVYSEDLGVRNYSGIPLHCCFNIYVRPDNEEIHKKPKSYRLHDVTVMEYRRNGTYPKPQEYDFGICAWGNGSCGKQIEYVGQYAQEIYVIINNPIYKEQVLTLCQSTDWRNLYPSVSSAKLQMWKIYKHIKENIAGIS